MIKKNSLENKWGKFVKNFELVNSLYRQGKFEKEIFYDGQYNLLESGGSSRAKKISLQIAANQLYDEAKEAWDAGNIPFENFSKILRSMTISFEVDEYFLCLSQAKKDFFLEFINYFWESKTYDLGEHFKVKMPDIANRIINFPVDLDAAVYIELANEMMLFNLCGVNVLYMNHSLESYQSGHRQVNKILDYIEIILQRKKRSSVSNKGVVQEQGALGLKGLAYFFEGRFTYGLGEFQASELAFKKSISLYIEEMNRLVPETGSKDAESRTLSLRRANFAEIIGLVNLYLIESRIDEALSILQRVRPLFEFNAGELTLAYCNLLNVSVNRAKYSSDEEKLKEIENSIQDCLKIFNKWVPQSHFPQRVNIELSLIYFYRTKKLPLGEIETRKEFYEKCFTMLNEAISYAEQLNGEKKIRNRRILVESLTIRSHIYRNYADLENDCFSERLKKAMNDAKKAERFAKGLKQLESEAVIAVGIVYRDLYAKKIFKAISLTDKEEKKVVLQDSRAFREKSRDYFFKAIDLNINNNPRISAICYLRLTELEMLNQSNYLRAKFFFNKFKHIATKVSHQYLLEFARELERELEEREGFEFLLDPKESLNFKYWRDKLEEFLIEQTIYSTALEIKGNLPNRRERGKTPVSAYAPVIKSATPRETRQSVLAKAFAKKMGIAPNKAYKMAKIHLKEFERLCEEISH